MNENDSSFSYIKKNSEYKWKELLYNLFYEIKSEILGKKIEIEEEEYQENIRIITIPKLVSYIHESIRILISNIQKKVEEDLYYIKKDKCKRIILEDQNEKTKYENIIKKLEEKERILYKENFHHQLQKEALENKIEEYMEMEDEFEEMKVKFKYEDGRFLNNDRKENEILILRSENSKLKNTLDVMEKNVKILEKLNQDKNKKIKKLNEELKELKLKNETKPTDLNLSQNYFHNFTNHNLTKNYSNNSRCIINHEEKGKSDNIIQSYYKFSNGKRKDKNEHNNTVKYYRNQNMNLYKGQSNIIKPKILSYKRKTDENNSNDYKKSSKGNTKNNNDLLNTTRNEFKDRLTHKYFSGNKIDKNKINKIINKNSLNKNLNEFKINKKKEIYGKYYYLFNKKNNKVNNIFSIKKLIASASVKSSRPNSIKKNNGFTHRSSSGE